MESICCPEHPSSEPFEDHHTGDIICTMCGLVVLERVLEPVNHYPSPKEQKLQYFEDFYPKVEISSVRRFAEQLHLPCFLIDKIETLFEKINALKIMKNKKEELCAAIAIFAICRLEGVPRSYGEISAHMVVDKKDICKYYKIVCETHTELKKYAHCVIDTKISRYCSNMHLPYALEKEANSKYFLLKEKYPNSSPNSLSALAIYLSAKENKNTVSLEQICGHVGVHPLTVRHHLRKLSRYQLC